MVFSSVPVNLNPHNWQQQLNPQPGGGRENNQLPLPVPSPSTGGGGGTGTRSIRPGSMAERAKLVNFPQPEAALKCPRCESTNTKFCYFNNYSLTQPRHFCKTCRRYWTRGGALRSVPVGGGCRKNKRSKGRRSKSPARIESRASSSSTAAVSTNMIGHLLPPSPQLPLLPSLPHLTDYGRSRDIGLNFAGIQPPVVATGGLNGGADMGFQIGSGSTAGEKILSARFDEQWRMRQVQRFPFFTGLEPPAGINPFEGEAGYQSGQLGSRPLDSGVSQPATMKIEENQSLNLSRNFLGLPGNDQYWGGNAWSDLSGFTFSSTSHL